MKRDPIEKFFNGQLSTWPLACDNFRALKSVETRKMKVGCLTVEVHFNPARIVSASADVGREAVRSRKCFLCRENRSGMQSFLKFEGRKSKKYDILVNPYPIFPGHLVIASDRHVEQCISKRFVDMLDIARSLPRYTVCYNGASCGASAPDHFHFQAACKGQMPLERAADSLLDSVSLSQGDEAGKDADGSLGYVASVLDAELYHYSGFFPGIFIIRSSTVKSAAKMFYRLADCASFFDEDAKEPMFNLLAWHTGKEYRTVVIFRRAHRPPHYFAEGDSRFMISPGYADMSGVIIAPLKEDFDRLSPEILYDMLSSVALDAGQETAVLCRMKRTQPELHVGIMSGGELEFEILSDGAGPRTAYYSDGKIEYDGALYDELIFDSPTPSTMFAGPSFVLYGDSAETESRLMGTYAGILRIAVHGDTLVAVNEIGVEDYIACVVSAGMKDGETEDALSARAVALRSQAVSLIGRRSVSHECFDVPADVDCLRYPGLVRPLRRSVWKAVDATWGQVRIHGGEPESGMPDTEKENI